MDRPPTGLGADSFTAGDIFWGTIVRIIKCFWPGRAGQTSSAWHVRKSHYNTSKGRALKNRLCPKKLIAYLISVFLVYTKLETVSNSVVPPTLIPNSPASPSAAAWCIYQKYALSQPLYQQEKDWLQFGGAFQDDDTWQNNKLINKILVIIMNLSIMHKKQELFLGIFFLTHL